MLLSSQRFRNLDGLLAGKSLTVGRSEILMLAADSRTWVDTKWEEGLWREVQDITMLPVKVPASHLNDLIEMIFFSLLVFSV